MHVNDKRASFILTSPKCSKLRITISLNPSALKERPSNGFIWVEQIVKAAAEVNEEITGKEMKLTRKPNKIPRNGKDQLAPTC